MRLNEIHAAYLLDPSEEHKYLLGKELYRFCDAYLKKRHCREEASYRNLKGVITITCTYVWREMAQHDPTKGRSFSSWVCLALDCRVKNVFREYARQGASALFDERGASTTQFDRLEAKLTIQKLTAMLSPADQKFIKMKLEGHTDKEIGLEFGLNLNAVWKHFIKLKADMKAKA